MNRQSKGNCSRLEGQGKLSWGLGELRSEWWIWIQRVRREENSFPGWGKEQRKVRNKMRLDRSEDIRARGWATKFYLYHKGNEQWLMGTFKDSNRWRCATRVDGVLATFWGWHQETSSHSAASKSIPHPGSGPDGPRARRPKSQTCYRNSDIQRTRHHTEALTWITGNMWIKSIPWIWWGSSWWGHCIFGRTETIFSDSALFGKHNKQRVRTHSVALKTSLKSGQHARRIQGFSMPDQCQTMTKFLLDDCKMRKINTI